MNLNDCGRRPKVTRTRAWCSCVGVIVSAVLLHGVMSNAEAVTPEHAFRRDAIDSTAHRALVGASLGYFLNNPKYKPNHMMVAVMKGNAFHATTRSALLTELTDHFKTWHKGPSHGDITRHIDRAENALIELDKAYRDQSFARDDLSALAGTVDSVTQYRMQTVIEKRGIFVNGRDALKVLLDPSEAENAKFAAAYLHKNKAKTSFRDGALEIVAKRAEVLFAEPDTAQTRRELKFYKKAVERSLLTAEPKLGGLSEISAETARTLGRLATRKTRRKVLRRLEDWHLGLVEKTATGLGLVEQPATGLGSVEQPAAGDVMPLADIALHFPVTPRGEKTFRQLLDAKTKLGYSFPIDVKELTKQIQAHVICLSPAPVITAVVAAISPVLYAKSPVLCAKILAEMPFESPLISSFAIGLAISAFAYTGEVNDTVEQWKWPRMLLQAPLQALQRSIRRLRRPTESETRRDVQLGIVEKLGQLAVSGSPEGKRLANKLKPAVAGVLKAREKSGLPAPEYTEALALPSATLADYSQKRRSAATDALQTLVALSSAHSVTNDATRAKDIGQIIQTVARLADEGALEHVTPAAVSKLNTAIAQLVEANTLRDKIHGLRELKNCSPVNLSEAEDVFTEKLAGVKKAVGALSADVEADLSVRLQALRAVSSENGI